MNLYLDNLFWVSVDIETTGINPYEHEIIEIGAVLFSLKSIKKRFQRLVKINKKQDPRAQAIHKITNEEVEKNGVSLENALSELLLFIGEVPLIFHNASFDLSFLLLGFSKQKIELPHNYYYDNLFISRTYFIDRKSHSLAYLREIYNIDTGESHRALADAEATALVFMISLSERYDQINSKKKMNSFLRYHRKADQFKLKLHKNFNRIEKYFNNYIKTEKSLHIKYTDKDNHVRDIRCVIKEIMVFNQNIFIKASVLMESGDILIPLKYAKIYDTTGILMIDSF